MLAAALAACGGGSETPRDASPDVPIDTGMCGSEAFFTGEIIDWDSTEPAFCGVFNSTLTVRGDAARTDKSNPNGRFELCLARQAETVIEVAHSTSESQCTSKPGSYLGEVGVARFIATQAVIDAGGMFSARAMTKERMAKVFTDLGQAYNPNQGQLVVHVEGIKRPVSLSTVNHSAAWVFDGTSWKASVDPNVGTGTDVFFPNVALDGAVQVVVDGGAIGTTTLTLEPGKLTYLTVVAK